MVKGKPAYRELENRLAELEKEARKGRRAGARLKKMEKQHQQCLSQLHERGRKLSWLRSAVNMPELVLDRNLNIVDYSTNFISITDRIAELRGQRKNLKDLLGEGDFEKIRQALEKIKALGKLPYSKGGKWRLRYKGPKASEKIGKDWHAGFLCRRNAWKIKKADGKLKIIHQPHVENLADCYLISAEEFGVAAEDIKIQYKIKTPKKKKNIRDLSLILSGAAGQEAVFPDLVGYTVCIGSGYNSEAGIQRQTANIIRIPESLQPDTEYQVTVERTGGKISRRMINLHTKIKAADLEIIDRNAIYDRFNHIGFHTFSGEAEFYDIRIYTRKSRFSINQFRIPFDIEVGIRDSKLQMRTYKLKMGEYTTSGKAFYSFLFEDITEYKRVEHLLRESEKKFRSIFESTTDGILLADGETREFKYANPAICRMLGYSEKQLRGMSVNDIHPQDSLKYVISEFEAQARGEKTIAEDIPLLRKDGAIIYTDINTAPIIIDGKKFNIGIYRDITERKQAEEILQQERDLLDRIMETSPAGIAMVDRDGRITFANTRAEEVLGLRRNEIVSRTYNDPRWKITDCNGGPIPDEKLPFRRVMSTGQPVFDIRYAIQWPEGKRVMLSVNSAPLFDHSGEVTGVVNYVEDISGKIELENQLRQAQKMESIGLLAGGVAHDFNNLLTSIMGYSSLMKKAKDLSEKHKKYMLEIERASQQGAEITIQLLTFSRKQPPRLSVTDLNSLVIQILHFLKRGFGPNISIETRLDNALGKINADSAQIQQVLVNLYMNARDAISDQGNILTTTSNIEIDSEYSAKHLEAKPGSYVLLAVTDNGAGMDGETLPRIFEPFFTTKETGKGTGLGLAIVYGIVKNHNGFINVYSEPGEGSTFKIYLPRAIEAEKAEPAPEPPVKGGNEIILVVDDEEMILNLAASILEDYGYKCLIASTGSDALKIYRQKHAEIDLAILDIVMPKMSGQMLFEEMLKIDPQVKVVMSSGFSVQDEGTMLEKGVKAFIPKPYREKCLAGTVREVLDLGKKPKK